MLICLLSGANVSAQVTVREASVEVHNIYEALYGIVDYSPTPDANGVIHIDVTGNVSEPESFTAQNIFNLPSNVKKIVIASTSSTKHDIVTNAVYQSSEATGNILNDYFLHFAYKFGELEVKNLTFKGDGKNTGKYFSWIASTSSTESDASAKSYFHDCVFYSCYQTNNVSDVISGGVKYLSYVYQFENNKWEYGNYYTFHCNPSHYKDNTTLIFSNNLMENFRGISIFPNTTEKFNVIAKDNKFYHNQTFVSFGGTSVCLCQVTGPLYGHYEFTGNTLLGLFVEKGVTETEFKTCALIMQHGANKYKGIVDGSSFVIKDNVLQCDVLDIAWKGGTGPGFETGSIREQILAGTYYNLWNENPWKYGDDKQKGEYTAVIENNNFVHMYGEKATQHHEADLCHVCNACGQIVLRAEVSGHGGTFQYEGEDHKMHDVNSAVHTIAKNLYRSEIAPGVDLATKVVSGLTRDGFRLDTGESQEFVITPTLPGAFRTLTFHGRGTAADVTSQATSSDGGKTYTYTHTNDFTRDNLYTECPELIASINFGTLIVTCNGLEKKDCALFVIEGQGALFWVNLSGEHPSKTISGLKPGNYTVKPHNISTQNWQWTYTMSPSSSTDKTVVADELVTVTYSVTKKSGVTVKHGENYKDNELEGSSAPDSINSWKKKGSYDL